MEASKRAVYRECLLAVARGNFLEDPEFQAMLGCDRVGFAAIADAFDDSTPIGGDVEAAVETALGFLVAYPHHGGAKWCEWIAVSPRQLSGLSNRQGRRRTEGA